MWSIFDIISQNYICIIFCETRPISATVDSAVHCSHALNTALQLGQSGLSRLGPLVVSWVVSLYSAIFSVNSTPLIIFLVTYYYDLMIQIIFKATEIQVFFREWKVDCLKVDCLKSFSQVVHQMLAWAHLCITDCCA